MSQLGPGLNEAQREALIRLIQEAGEVIQSATKLMMYGETAQDPFTGREYDNVRDLSMEIGDLHEMIEEAHAQGLIEPSAVQQGKESKRMKLIKYRIVT